MKTAWPLIESAPYIDSWHIGAICEHLQAVWNGQIENLIINIPPGCSKSLIVCVFFQTWGWANDPTKRWLFASYDQRLSTRDSVKCRALFESRWFQDHFPGQVEFAKDQNQKTYYENTKGGYRLATSVGGHGTGQHPDIIVCLPYNTVVDTTAGPLKIGDVVEGELDVSIKSFNHTTNRIEWKEIERHEKGMGRKCLRIRLANGKELELTEDHPVWVLGKGYLAAKNVRANDKVIYDKGLFALPERVLHQAEPGCELLQPAMLFRSEEKPEHERMRSMRQDVLSLSGAHSKERNEARQVLFDSMFRQIHNGCESSSLSRLGGENLQGLWEAVQGGKAARKRSYLLFNEMPWCRAKEEAGFVDLQELRKASQATEVCGNESTVLLPSMRKRRTSTEDGWTWKSTVDARQSERAVHRRIQSNQEEDSQTGWEHLRFMWDNITDLPEEIRYSPHRLRQAEQPRRQSNQSVPMVSWWSTWNEAQQSNLETQVVTAVEQAPTPETVYNICVKDNHNYFANGILVHNCDDPNNAKQAESEQERQSVTEWWTLTMSTRGVSRKVRRVIIQQRLHEEDLTGSCLAQGGYEHLCLPMRYDGPRSNTSLGFADPRTIEGDLLTPKLFDELTVQKLEKALGPYGSAGQLQQRPAPKTAGFFKPEKIEIVDAAPVEVLTRVRGWDTASTASGGDYTVGVKMTKTKEGIYYIEDVVRGQYSPEERPKVQRQTADIDYAYPICHSVKQVQGEEPGSAGKDQAQAFVKLMSGYPCETVRQTGAKDVRAFGFASQVNGGNVKIVRAEWNRAFLEELRMFPMGKHDDQIDAASTAFNDIELKEKPEFLPKGWSF